MTALKVTIERKQGEWPGHFYLDMRTEIDGCECGLRTSEYDMTTASGRAGERRLVEMLWCSAVVTHQVGPAVNGST